MHPIAEPVLDHTPPAVRDLARAVFAELHRLFPEAVITADARTIGLGTAPGYQGLVFTIIPATRHITLGIAGGATLPDPAGVLEGTGRVHRHIKVRNEDDLRRPEVTGVLDAALDRAL